MLHDTAGVLRPARILAGSVMVMSGSIAPRAALHRPTPDRRLASCSSATRSIACIAATAPGSARYLGPMTALLAVATLLDTINEHSIITTFTTLYLTQVCFALVILAVSLALRRESLRTRPSCRCTARRWTRSLRLVCGARRGQRELALRGQGAARHRGGTAPARRRAGRPPAPGADPAGRAELGRAIDEVTRVITTLFEARLRARAAADGRRAWGRRPIAARGCGRNVVGGETAKTVQPLTASRSRRLGRRHA